MKRAVLLLANERRAMACIAAIIGAVLLTGCKKEIATSESGPAKVRVGYIGLTCEAPIFTAVTAVAMLP